MTANRCTSLLALLMLLVSAPTASGEEEAGRADGSTLDAGATGERVPGSSDESAGAGSEDFSLGLDRMAFGRPGSFRLFASQSNIGGSRLRLLPSGDDGSTVVPPRPSGLDGLSAKLTWQGDRTPDGLSFDFSAKTWDDLDGWEKTGLVMSRASAAAGLGYLLYELFD